MKVAAILARKRSSFECVDECAPMSEVVDLMHRQAIGSVGVLNGNTMAVIGLVSQHEVTAALATMGMAALAAPVTAFMRSPALNCACDDDAADVMRNMTRERSRHAIVRALSGKVAGIVSLGDLVAAMLDDARLEAGVLRDMALSHLLSARA